jgi:3-deoxy-7-phosphoheptulonate synthase
VEGFKNTMEGDTLNAVQACLTAMRAHSFPGRDISGLPMHIHSTGNPTAHVILRGGTAGPNYFEEDIANTAVQMESKDTLPAIVVDLSHQNSGKKADKQLVVGAEVFRQVATGQPIVKGVMVESFLRHGAQRLDIAKSSELTYGMSVTDECIGLDQTESLMVNAVQAVQKRREILTA